MDLKLSKKEKSELVGKAAIKKSLKLGFSEEEIGRIINKTFNETLNEWIENHKTDLQ